MSCLLGSSWSRETGEDLGGELARGRVWVSALSAEGSERGSRSLATRLQYHGGGSVEGEGSQAACVLARVSWWSKMVSGRYGATRLLL